MCTLREEYLTQVSERLRLEQHKPTTCHTYHDVWVNLNDFLIKLDKRPDSWDDRLALFMAELREENKPGTTVSSYVLAVRVVLKSNGIEMKENIILLSLLIRSCKVNNKSETSLRLMTQRALLNLMIDKIEHRFISECNQNYLSKLHMAILVTNYYGLLRIGEMTLTESQCFICRCTFSSGQTKSFISPKIFEDSQSMQHATTRENIWAGDWQIIFPGRQIQVLSFLNNL